MRGERGEGWGGARAGAPNHLLSLSTGRADGFGESPRILSTDTLNRNAGALNSNEYPAAYPFKSKDGRVGGPSAKIARP